MLDKQREAENQAKKRLEHIYGPDHAENKRYNEEEYERRQREKKKTELKALLQKYVSSGSHNEFVALNIKEAQEAQRELGEKRDKYSTELQELEQQCK